MPQLTLEQAFALALQNQQAGRLPEAAQLYEQILAVQPDHPEAPYHLGLIAQQMQRMDIAIALMRRSIELRPTWQQPRESLGEILLGVGRVDQAIDAYQQALAICPESALVLGNLGVALGLHGRLDEAIASFQRAIQVKPDFADAHNNLGHALMEAGLIDEAIIACQRAIAINPNLAGAHNNLGNALREKGQSAAAVVACRQAITLNPAFPEAHNNLGNALTDEGKFEQAIAAYRQAIALRPDYATAHNNTGMAMREMGRLDDALSATRKAISLQPDLADAHFNLSQLLLQQGNYAQGWQEHEWRWLCTTRPRRRLNAAQPQWNGSDLTGQTILLHAEQGFGDIIQFSRYIPLVAERGGRVIVSCPPSMLRLIQSIVGVQQCVDWDEPSPAFDAPFDAHCPLLSLPLVFNTSADTIPASVPYFSVPAAETIRWQHQLKGDRNHLRVGLAWAGRAKPKGRSFDPNILTPLADVPGVSFYSLQKSEAGRPTNQLQLIDLSGELRDFADSAALISNLDLVISIDTAVAHLAGAMGKPVWTLLKFVPDWRWGLGRDRNRWYPSMRLFRQTQIGDWPGVIGEVATALATYRSSWKIPRE